MYTLVVCGGTFDRLHTGHMAFLDGIFDVSQHVVIGLTSDSYVTTYKSDIRILPYEKRLQELQTFLKERGYNNRAKIAPINDVYGEAIDKKYPFEAIVVSDETKKGGETTNQKRDELGLSQLPIVSIPILTTETGVKLSSTLIRSGKVGRQGQFFPNPKWSRQVLHLPDNMREVFHKPFGSLYKDIPFQTFGSSSMLISVGDATTKKILENGITPKLSVIDFTVERKKLYEKIEDLGFSGEEVVSLVHNPASTLTPQLWEHLEEIDSRLTQSHNFVLRVEGEEDLVVIPLVLLLPLGWKIVYGQPHEGVVILEVTEEAKVQIFAYLTHFTSVA